MSRRMLAVVLVGVAAVALIVTYVLVDSDSGGREASPTDSDLETRADTADAACRGGQGDVAPTWQACDVRQALLVDLKERGRCLDDQDRWGGCLRDNDDGEHIEVCPAATGRAEVLITGLSCAEATQLAADASRVSTEPTSVDRFTCVASGAEKPRTVWCGDYGADLAPEETTPSAIVWRLSA